MLCSWSLVQYMSHFGHDGTTTAKSQISKFTFPQITDELNKIKCFRVKLSVDVFKFIDGFVFPIVFSLIHVLCMSIIFDC